jgi:hypothetical protein
VTKRIRSAPIPTGERARGFVGVDVERPLRDRCNHRHLPARERELDVERPGRYGISYQPELGNLRRTHADLVSEQPDRTLADRVAKVGVHERERAADEPIGGRARHPPAADELDLEPVARHRLRDLRASAVHDADLVFVRKVVHERRRVGRNRAAELQDDLHER